jgi:alpha-1,3-mannosyltransferase
MCLLFRWCRKEGGLLAVMWSAMERLVLSVRLTQRGGLRGRARDAQARIAQAAGQKRLPQLPELAAGHILLVVFSGNFIGIVCARTLHYQFYSWCCTVRSIDSGHLAYSALIWIC